MEDTVLTVDCGTQSLRAMLFSRTGMLLDKAKVPYEPYFSPRPGWAEQDAGTYWEALCAAVRTLKARSGPAFALIQGVGVAALRNSPVLVDAEGEPLRSAILWLDTRKARRVYRPDWARHALYAAIGVLPVLLHAQEDCKTTWVRQNQPELWDRAAKVLQVSGFLNHRLTGRFQDSIASQIGHTPFNYRALRWCRAGELNARAFPVEPGKLPELVLPGSIIGPVTRAAAAATGLAEGVPVIACASDKGAECLGTGCTGEAMASLSLGTAAVVQTISPRYFEPLPFMPAYPAPMPGQHCPEIQVFRGYWMINWFLREFAAQELAEGRALGVPPEKLLDRFLRDVPAGSMGLMTLPHWGAQLKDPAAKGSMIGLGEVHTRGYFYRSLIEGLAFGLRDGLERIERAGRFRADRIGIAGGASQSAEICQITADIFDRPLWAGETFEAAGLGAAALTAAGAGLHGSVAEAVGRMVRPGRIFAPRAANAGLYRDLYHKVHRRIQRRLGPLNAQIRRILDYPQRSPEEDA
jgi:sugar (pentulose or hexulose) kinase